MLRRTWSHLAVSGFRSLLQRLACRPRRDKRARLRLRRTTSAWGAFTVAAELCEARQMLSAAIFAISPNSGSTSGGTSVGIQGSGFQNVMGIEFGSTMATSFQVTS